MGVGIISKCKINFGTIQERLNFLRIVLKSIDQVFFLLLLFFLAVLSEILFSVSKHNISILLILQVLIFGSID